MNHIGNVIKTLRCNLGLSRNDTSKDICTEKYLYLIEKGERNPSVEMNRFIGDRLGTNLFTYYEYLDCNDPIQVYDAITRFNLYRRSSDFKSLYSYNRQIMLLPDFQKGRWKYEIEVNRLSCMAFIEQQYDIVVRDAEEILKRMDKKYLEEEFTANLYVLLSTCYQCFNDIKNSERALEKAYKKIENKENIPRYNQVIISTKLNNMTLCHLNGKYDAAIEDGLWIYHNKLGSSLGERSNYTFYYLAYSYYKKEMYQEAFKWFQKCLYDLLIYNNPIAAYYISNYNLFYDFLNDKRISSEMVREIKSCYDFI